jgi:hypothetical protein
MPPRAAAAPDTSAAVDAGSPSATTPRRTRASSGSRFGLVLFIVGLLVLVLGAGLAVGGLVAKASADDRAATAAADLLVAGDDRDSSQVQRDQAVDRKEGALQNQQDAEAEAQRVAEVSARADAAVDQLTDCNQRMRASGAEILSAIEAGSYERAQTGIDAYNAAVDDCNAALSVYMGAVAELFGQSPDDTLTA